MRNGSAAALALGCLALGAFGGLWIPKEYLPGFQSVAVRDAGPLERIERAVAAKFNDPESVRLANVRVAPVAEVLPAGGKPFEEFEVVCGDVNAKNRMGGYVGAEPFVGFYMADGAKFLQTADSILIRMFESDFAVGKIVPGDPIFVMLAVGRKGAVKGWETFDAIEACRGVGREIPSAGR